jgi:small subunit ribosomal protein S6
MYIVKPDLEEDVIKEVIAKFHAIITDNGGTIDKHTAMGKRKIAFEMNDYREGYYDLINFTAGTEVVAELERVFRITEDVLRFLLIKDEK